MTITAEREALEAVLTAAGVLVMPAGGAASPPCAFVVPSDPWIAPSTLGKGWREIGLEVLAIAGVQADDGATRNALEAITGTVLLAIMAAPEWTGPTTARPATLEIGGAVYVACRIRTGKLIQLT